MESGEQDCEIRPLNHRGWNLKNIYPSRWLNISHGYGKQRRHRRCITRTHTTTKLQDANIPQWHIDAVNEIYPNADRWLIAYVK